MFQSAARFRRVQHHARRQNLRQDDGRFVGIFRIHQNQRHAGAVVAVQFRRDGVGKMRVIGHERDGVDFLELRAHGGNFNGELFVDLAGQAPVGGKIHQHGFSGGARLRDGFGRPRLPVNAAGRILGRARRGHYRNRVTPIELIFQKTKISAHEQD